MKKVETKIIDGINYRKCNKCGEFKQLDEYYQKNKNNPNWIDSICKPCRKVKSTKRQHTLKEEINIKRREKILNDKGLKSPFNYIGNKYSRLNEIKENVPNNINTFIDLFCGSTTVAINMEANNYIVNDIDSKLIEFLKLCQNSDPDIICESTQDIINSFDANSEQGYIKLRDHYNQVDQNPYIYYALTCNAFNQHLMYNKSGGVTTGYGSGVANFNFILKKRIKEYSDRIKSIDIQFLNNNYLDILNRKFEKGDFVFVDPPYLMSNSSSRYYSNWTENDEFLLLRRLDDLTNIGVNFMLTNVLKSKGEKNNILDTWRFNYNTIELDSNFNRVSRNHENVNKSEEVMIMNY